MDFNRGHGGSGFIRGVVIQRRYLQLVPGIRGDIAAVEVEQGTEIAVLIDLVELDASPSIQLDLYSERAVVEIPPSIWEAEEVVVAVDKRVRVFQEHPYERVHGRIERLN